MKPKAYSYIRFSSPEQSRGDSLRRQLEAANTYALEHDLELVSEEKYKFFDAGISAYRGRHDSDAGRLRRFYDYVESGDIEAGSYLLVESLDRLSRQEVPTALSRFIDLLNAGINVVTVSDGMIYTKDVDVPQLVMSIFHMGRAHHESKQKGKRVSDAWKHKQKLARENKTPIGRACPYWMEFKDGVYVIIPERGAIVQKIFEMTIDGYGQIAIAKHLNSIDIPVFGSSSRNESQLWGASPDFS